MTMTEETTATRVIGQRLLRKEDPVLLTGEAVFANDMKVPGALHMAVLRSPYASATIVSIDTSAAAAMPGVRAVYTGADLADQWAAPMPCAWAVTEDMLNPPHHPIAIDAVHYVGDGVAVVLADTDTIAHDAIEAIDVEYDSREPIIELEDALSDRVLVHPDLGTNSSYTWNLLVEETDEYLRYRTIRSYLFGLGTLLTLATIWGFFEQFNLVFHLYKRQRISFMLKFYACQCIVAFISQFKCT